MEARGERDHARRTGLSSTLAVPVSIGGGCIGALVLGSAQRFREWPLLVQNRARLVAEIIGSALFRSRQEAALRSSLAEIQRLNSCLTAENVCLKEDIKTFHDFDEIVGESAVMRAAHQRRLAVQAPTSTANVPTTISDPASSGPICHANSRERMSSQCGAICLSMR